MTDIIIEGVSKAFDDKQVLDDVNLQIRPGELMCLLGPSGCGKSTLLRIIAGLETPDGGRISFGDHVVFDAERRIDLPPEQRDLGMVFQTFALWPHKTVFDNVAYPLRRRKVRGSSMRERVMESLEMVGLSDRARSYPGTLSGGQQQRVALARAVVSRPRVLLFDEPLSSLDTNLRRQMRAEIRRFQSFLGVTSVFVTHDREDSGALADRVTVLQSGAIVQIGASHEVFSLPRTPFVAEFGGFDTYVKGSASTGRDGSSSVLLPNGQLFPVTQTPAPGTGITLGLRSRLLEVSHDDDHTASGEVVMRGKVEGVADLGGEVDVTVTDGSLQLVARVRPAGRRRLAAGDLVTVTADAGSWVSFVD